MKFSNCSITFQHVFYTTVLITLLSGGGCLWLSKDDQFTPHQTRIFETLTTTWNMGVGAIIGLLGSQTLGEDE